LFEQQARNIIDARKLRGMNSLDSGNIFLRLREYSAIVNPLILKAMMQALDMGLVMDARAFGAYKTRVWLTETRMSALDYITLTSGVFFSAAVITLNFTIGR